MSQYCCERCGKPAPDHDFIYFGPEAGTRLLCTQCFNARVAEKAQIDDFDNRALEPISLPDVDGVDHVFHFQATLLGPMVVLDAFELMEGKPAGYQFREIGRPEEERYEQLARLVQKIRGALAAKFLQDGPYGPQIRDMEARGRIESDSSSEGDLFTQATPLLVIDGRKVSWEEFGRMLMTFEGFQFKLQISDASDSLDL
ncbi:hypothetical protein [Rhodoferax sp. GW822-FHT02A01]|uniref:DUF7713 domain-containing protein n=1 Tax=Rhodoferax sp. GW822-FHT02A01 TaxID=3141537 RepID=UPI00315D0996